MSTRAALEAALEANPEDPALLAALADHYIESGDPRGEYLRIWFQVSSMPGESDAKFRLSELADAVWHEHRTAMWGPLARFADHIECNDWHYCWPSAVQSTKLTPEFLAAAADSPLLHILYVYPDNPADCGDEGVELLIHSRLIGRLSELELFNCGITDDGALALAACPAVRKLQHLRLDDNYLSPIGIEALAAVGHRDIGRQFYGPNSGAEYV